LRIRRLMKIPVHTVKPRDTVAHARSLIEEYRINQLPVVVNRSLVGIVTDRDLRDARAAVTGAAETATRAHLSAPPGDKITVESVMTTKVLTLTPAHTLVDAARLMRRERIGAIPIVEHNALAGILTRSDILDAFIEANEPEGRGIE
jgi:acetoin utilization protein AcuB